MTHALIGRTAELEELDRFLAGTGRRGLFLEGTAGIGKTRLWQEGVDLARRRGQRVLSTRPASADTQLSFAGFADLLEGALDDVLTQLPPPQRRALEVALLLDEHSAPPDQRTVATAFLASLRFLAEEAPVVIAADDLQWLDPASLQVLAFALRRLDREPISLLGTVRLAAEEREPAEVASAVGDALTRIRLEPLSLGGIFELLRTRLQLKLSRPTVQRVHETSGGNAFFALELGRALRESGSEPPPGEPLPLPRELTDVVRQRLARLSPSASKTLLYAAALSRPTVPAVAALCRTAESDLAEARAADVIEFDGDVIRFGHPLLASIHYGSAAPWERRGVHARLADTVDDSEERARHRALSVEGPDERAAAALEEAAARAKRRGALAAAADLAGRAVAATPPDATSGAHRRRLAAAEYTYASGDTARALELLEAALPETPPGTKRAELLWTLGKIRYEGVDTRLGFETCRRALEEVGEDLALRARILESLAFGENVLGVDYAESEAYARDAVVAAEEVGDTATLARALARVANIERLHGGPIAFDVFERAVALEESLGGLELDSGPTILYARCLLEEGLFDRARELLGPLCDRGRERGDAAVFQPVFTLARVEFFSGKWPRAEELAREAYDLAVQTGREAAESRALFLLCELEAARGNVDEAHAAGQEGVASMEAHGYVATPRGSLSSLELSLENYEAAYEVVMPAVERYHRLGRSFVEEQLDAVEALAGLGRIEEARTLLEPGEEAARATGLSWIRMIVARARGLVAAADGDLADAESALEEAVEAGRAAGAPLELGRSLLALGSVQRRRRKKQIARETLTEALEILDGLGARIWADRTRRELDRIGGRSASRSKLSATEAEIAALVGAGRSNHEVAATLHLSPKTVEWNLSKIYRKLGVHSRTEMAAKLAKNGASAIQR